VIIDAAHGGADHGAALGPKLSEKDLTIALAHRLRHELEVRGISSTLVREGDATLTPDQRAAIANASKAAVYISLHASSTGSGIRIYSSMLAPTPRATLAFAPVHTAQASQVSHSRAVASAMANALLKRDVPAASLPASIAPLNSIAIPAIVVEVGTPTTGADDFSVSSFQQSLAASLANAIAAAQSQLPREVPQ
jgi:N-acetylmuramoyl-L-alanine amidase